MANTLQISSLFLLFPFFIALWQTATNRSNRFLHATTGALFVSSVMNHSRPHGGPVYDEIDNVDKLVVTVNVLAACFDALGDDVSKQTVLSCSVLASVVGSGSLTARRFAAKTIFVSDRTSNFSATYPRVQRDKQPMFFKWFQYGVRYRWVFSVHLQNW